MLTDIIKEQNTDIGEFFLCLYLLITSEYLTVTLVGPAYSLKNSFMNSKVFQCFKVYHFDIKAQFYAVASTNHSPVWLRNCTYLFLLPRMVTTVLGVLLFLFASLLGSSMAHYTGIHPGCKGQVSAPAHRTC